MPRTLSRPATGPTNPEVLPVSPAARRRQAAALLVLAVSFIGWRLLSQSGNASLDGSIIAHQTIIDEGYRWQICTDNAMIDITDVTSGAWTNEAYGVGDPTNGVFVTEVAAVWLGTPTLTGYRIDPIDEFTITIEGDNFPVDQPDGWHPFINQYAESVAIGHMSDEDNVEYQEIDRLFYEHHVDVLRTFDGVVTSFNLKGASSVIQQDKSGSDYVRFEQQAVGHLDIHPHTINWGAEQLGYFNTIRGSAWTLDVWTNGTGTVERIRLQTQEFGRHWAELRFIEGGVDTDLPGPGGPTRLGYGPSCPTNDHDVTTLGWMGFEPWDATVKTPVDATLDPSGRPYDATNDGSIAKQKPLGTLVATDRSVFVSDAFIGLADLKADFPPRVEFDGAPQGDINLDATILTTTSPEYDGAQIYGIRLDLPGSIVDRWTPFEMAYCTDGGTGRISSWQSLEQLSEYDDPFYEVEVWFGDADGHVGNDTIVFSNGFGDGCYPMSRGLNFDGGTVALVVWNPMYPWRLMIPDGTPPSDITQREDEIQQCLDGIRPMEPWGFCSHSDE